jgi:Fe-S cluster biogenesis protein NfuA
MERIESLLEKVELFADPVARDTTREIVQTLMDLHGEALAKILDRVTESEAGQAILDAMSRDPAIASVLMLHDLQPSDLETRVRTAVNDLRPALTEQGVTVQLLAIEDGLVRLNLKPNNGSPNPTLDRIVEEAILEMAPEIDEVEILHGTSPTIGRFSLPLVAPEKHP